jgi:uncharacterized protein (TIGR04141 family)
MTRMTVSFHLPSFNRFRKFARILMSQSKSPHRHWTSEEEELLGRKSDRTLARKFGRSVAAVAARRRQHQISLIKPWRPADDKLLGVIEERFGLKVVLNLVSPDSFRNITKTTLGSVPKHSQEQMTRDVTASEFGIDVEQDLIGSVTGKSKDPQLGKVITGKDSLNCTVKSQGQIPPDNLAPKTTESPRKDRAG